MPGRTISCLQPCQRSCRIFAHFRCRFYSAKVLTGDDLGPIHQDVHQSYRVLDDGQKLPLPPVLDPIVLAETSRWEQTKKKPRVDKFTPFQKKLWENPYAHALASPVRLCRATSSLLPESLQIALHPQPHTSTKTPWLLPVSLTTSTRRLGPPYRYLAHAFITAHLTKKKQWQKGLYQRFTEKLGKKKVEQIVWREDMASLILDLLRKRVLKKLRWFFKRSGQLEPCASPRSEDINDFDDVSCIIYLNSLRTSADDLHAKSAAIVAEVDRWAAVYTKHFPAQLDPHKKPGVSHYSPVWYIEPLIPRLQPRLRFSPLEFKTTIWRGSKVAIYSLHDLLGEEKAKELIESWRFKGERCFVMKRRKHNVPVELLLMQLQAYLAEPGP